MTDSTILTATAALRGARRAGLAVGARRNAETEPDSRSVARFWLALAVLLEDPGPARVGALRTVAADLGGEVRGIMATVLGKSAGLVAVSDPALAELWKECRCVLFEAGDDEQRDHRQVDPGPVGQRSLTAFPAVI